MANPRFVTVTRYASVLCSGVLAGVALTVLVLELALRQLDGPGYVHVRQAEFSWFTPFVGAIFVPTLVAVILLVIHAWNARSPSLRPAVVALVLLLLALVVSLVVNGPINVEQLVWNAQAPPAGWASVRDRWQVAHAVRVVLIVAALGYVSVAVVDRPLAHTRG
jgi:hypothetical protein